MEKQKGVLNITINSVHLWAATLVLFLTIGGTLAGGIVTVKDAYDQVKDNKEKIEKHEARITRIENTVNDLDSTIRTINELRQSLDEFKIELESYRREWTELYKNYDLKKK